jgi:hypothetical protein
MRCNTDDIYRAAIGRLARFGALGLVNISDRIHGKLGPMKL